MANATQKIRKARLEQLKSQGGGGGGGGAGGADQQAQRQYVPQFGGPIGFFCTSLIIPAQTARVQVFRLEHPKPDLT